MRSICNQIKSTLLIRKASARYPTPVSSIIFAARLSVIKVFE